MDSEIAREHKQLSDLNASLRYKESMGLWMKGILVALASLAVAVITLITALGTVEWSAAQTALATTEAGAAIGFLTAITAHFWPSTPREPVAVAATLTAFASATVALGTGFNWWTLTEDQVSALMAVVTAVLGVFGALLARQTVFARLSPKAPTRPTGRP